MEVFSTRRQEEDASMIRDIAKWHELIREYRGLRHLEGHTAQSRGQRFNNMIAELLRCWGVEAIANVRNTGEIDVMFSVSGVRYVLEAKWQKPKADTGQIAKLQKRVRQRLAGTYGVVLSMSGFSSEALAEVSDGERLEVLLLDASHWEAMLTGLVPPEELMRLMHDRAAFHGDAHASLAKLLRSTADIPSVRFGPPPGPTHNAIRSAADGVTGETVLSGIVSNQLGVAVRSNGHLLVTTAASVLDIDLDRQVTAVAVPVADCLRNTVPLEDGSVMFARRHGVGRFHAGELTAVGGGGTGNISLLRQPDGSVWLYDNGGLTTPGASLTKLGEQAGDEERYALGWPPACSTGAAWVSDELVASVGNSSVVVSDIPELSDVRRHAFDAGNPMGTAHIGGGIVLVTADWVAVHRVDTKTGNAEQVADLNGLAGSMYELAHANGDVFVAAYQDPAGAQLTFAVVRLQGLASS
ncbi:restriction endonuclease [Lentzea sp. CA-135723]|uniref:restriction endonuclease n=1 Tax=Lentzea sp. CA-135723 TaxID=3239950 RepID=UPI003D8C23BD